MRGPRVFVAPLAFAAVAIAAPLASPAGAAGGRAVVVIGGSAQVVSFGGSISGLSALGQVASIETISYGGVGQAVCKINGVGNPAVPGECLGEKSGQYWAYFRSPPGSSGWTYSSGGAGATSVSDGGVEGWQFGGGSPPPYRSFCSVAGCAPPATPAPTAPPTAATTVPVATAPSSGEAVTTAPPATAGTTPERAPAGASTTAPGDSSPDSTNPGTRSNATDRRDDDGDGREQASAPQQSGGGNDGGSGSPWGVIGALAVVTALGGGGWWLRRSRAHSG